MLNCDRQLEPRALSETHATFDECMPIQ